MEAEIEKAMVITSQLIDDIDLHIVHFSSFGRGFMKTCKISPDAYVQMALQLAYYRVCYVFLSIFSLILLYVSRISDHSV